eukprot:CAMPEP_0169182302 /NCGR_PEP_ID=MMETSP1015-20121227/69143_1 /TAXON_ID=342587 /ORGANISM="Karlodinium micrum, Strain CCMP2283" /LENGTH=67 /DNA_ID=CAMNT_0009257491 /DNA_START=78 /DNA_END=281 /DNA_ORIENTATION=-
MVKEVAQLHEATLLNDLDDILPLATARDVLDHQVADIRKQIIVVALRTCCFSFILALAQRRKVVSPN